jgi:hypothetical protein
MTGDDASIGCRMKVVKKVLDDSDEAVEDTHGDTAEHQDTRVDDASRNSRNPHRRDGSDCRTWDNLKHNPKILEDR